MTNKSPAPTGDLLGKAAPVGAGQADRLRETCGRFVRSTQVRTVWHAYDIDFSLPVAVYSEATATRLMTRLDCASCSMRCSLMRESKRGHGIAVGPHLPNGWERCARTATQADYATAVLATPTT